MGCYHLSEEHSPTVIDSNKTMTQGIPAVLPATSLKTIGSTGENPPKSPNLNPIKMLCLILTKCLLTQQFVHYVSPVSSHSSSLSSSSRDILLMGLWKRPPAVLTRADHTPQSSPVNTFTTHPIGQLLGTTVSSATRSTICTFHLDLTHFGLLWRVGKYSHNYLF